MTTSTSTVVCQLCDRPTAEYNIEHHHVEFPDFPYFRLVPVCTVCVHANLP